MPSMSVPMATWSMPTASAIRLRWSMYPLKPRPPNATGKTPTTPPPCATSRACSRLTARAARDVDDRVREHRRLARRLCRRPDAVHRRVGHVDEHPQPVHLADHVAAERGEAAVPRRLGLDVAQLVDPVVHQLDRADPAIVGLLDTVEPALEEIAALDGQDGGGSPAAPRVLEIR